MKFSWLTDRIWASSDLAEDGQPHSTTRSYRLESVLPGARFNATIQAWWFPVDPSLDRLIYERLLAEGSVVSRRFSVLDLAAANDAVNDAFAVEQTLPPGHIRIVAARAELSVGKEELAFAEQRAAIELRSDVDAAEMHATHARLLRLRDLFLSDRAMVGLWWSQGDPDRMLRLKEKSGELESIVSLVTASRDGLVREDRVSSLIERFLEGLGPDHRQWLIAQLAKVFESYQQPKLAEELQEISLENN